MEAQLEFYFHLVVVVLSLDKKLSIYDVPSRLLFPSFPDDAKCCQIEA